MFRPWLQVSRADHCPWRQLWFECDYGESARSVIRLTPVATWRVDLGFRREPRLQGILPVDLLWFKPPIFTISARQHNPAHGGRAEWGGRLIAAAAGEPHYHEDGLLADPARISTFLGLASSDTISYHIQRFDDQYWKIDRKHPWQIDAVQPVRLEPMS